jgi:putative redox protein
MAPEKNARVVWLGEGKEFRAHLSAGFEYTMHSPADENGGTPMDYLLAGVAGCTAIDVIGILQKKRQNVAGLEVHIHGTQAETAPNVYTKAHITYVVRGENISPAAVEQAIELSETKYCSASIMFQRSGTEVTTEYRIEETAPAVIGA